MKQLNPDLFIGSNPIRLYKYVDGAFNGNSINYANKNRVDGPSTARIYKALHVGCAHAAPINHWHVISAMFSIILYLSS